MRKGVRLMIMRSDSSIVLRPEQGTENFIGLRQRFWRANVDKSKAFRKCGKGTSRQPLKDVAFQRRRRAGSDHVEQWCGDEVDASIDPGFPPERRIFLDKSLDEAFGIQHETTITAGILNLCAQH